MDKDQASSLITIVLPIYNVAPYIERCLASICSQKGIEHAELLLIDDESPDNSVEIARQSLEQYPDVKWRLISQKNRGLGGARNTGIHNASTSFLWFVDTDDEIAPDSLSRIIDNLNDKDDVIAFAFKPIPDRHIGRYRNDVSHLAGPDMMKHVVANQVWRNIYRRDFLLENNLLFREKFLHEDSEFSMRVFTFARSMSYKDIVIYYYHTNNPGSITNNFRYKNAADLLSYIDTYYGLRQTCDLSHDQLWTMQKEVSFAIFYIYANSHRYKKGDWKPIKRLIKENRGRIMESVSMLPFRTRLAHGVLSLLRSKWLYGMLFNEV